MKRPFACIGFSMLFSLVFAISVHTAVDVTAVVCFVVSIVLFVLKFSARKNTLSAAVCCLSACIALFGYMAVVKYHVQPITAEYSGKTVTFSGMIVSNPYTNGGNTHFTVKTDKINGESKSLKINVTASSTQPMEMYDFVEGKANLSSEYEGGYNYASYYGARDIFLSCYINTYYDSEYKAIHNDNKPFCVIFNNMRKYIAKTFQKYLPYDESSLCAAIITGEKMYLKDNVYSAFKNLGVSHMLVVSGLHLSIAAALIYFAVSNTFYNEYIIALVQILGVTAFAMLSGFGFSVRRAFVMILISILGRLLMSKTDSLNTLGFAAFLLCLNPLNVGDIGLLWSFSCTLSIILLANKITDDIVERFKIKRSFFLKLTTMFSTAAAAFVGSVPFLILVTGSISPYTILVNILTVPFTGVIIVCGGFSVLLFALHINAFAYPLMILAGLTAKYLTFITNMFQNMPYSSIGTNKTFVYIWFAAAAVVILLTVIFDKRKRYLKICVLASVSVFVGLYSLNTFIDGGKVTFSVLDVGNGLTLTVKNNDNIVVLNSYGEKYQYNTIKTELSNFCDIACLIDIPPSKPDYNYCRKITHDFDVSKVIVYDDKMYNQNYSYLRYSGTDVEKISDNYKLIMFDSVDLNIITTKTGTWQYLTIYNTDILICPTNADLGELPDTFKTPDIAVISDVPSNFNFDNNVIIVLSACEEKCSDIKNIADNDNITIEATNGQGRIDFEFSERGAFYINRIYTGGVTRYADSQ